ncbi:MAG: hypothetical protein ACWGHH_06750 [Sulfurovaceae bacterium]
MMHKDKLEKISRMTLDEIEDYRRKVSLSNLTGEKKEILFQALDDRAARHDINAAIVEMNFEGMDEA